MLFNLIRRKSHLAIAVLAATALTACTDTSVTEDPYEETNRSIHAFNKSLDRNVLKPGSEAYAAAVPRPVRRGVSNGVSNLGEPVNFINHTLQGDIESAGSTFFRFAINTVFGFGGLLDPAGDAGLYERESDFGETLAVWGVRPGAYLELPVLGPSTERDAFGKAVDFAVNPLNYIIESETGNYLLAARAVNVLETRHEYARIVETLLYESADSYSAARIAYLQNRARNVADGIATEDLEDPFAFE